jgi:hypothetical protein
LVTLKRVWHAKDQRKLNNIVKEARKIKKERLKDAALRACGQVELLYLIP